MDLHYYIVGSKVFCSRFRGFLSPRMLPFYLFGYFRSCFLSWKLPCGYYLATLCHSSSSYSFLWVSTLRLESKIPDYAGFWCCESCTWSWPLTQDPFFWPLSLMFTHYLRMTGIAILAFKLVVIVVIKFWQLRTSPTTSHGRCSLMEPNRSRQEYSSWVSYLYSWLCHTLPSLHGFSEEW